MRNSALVIILLVAMLAGPAAFSQSAAEPQTDAASADGQDDGQDDGKDKETPLPGQQMAQWFRKAAEAYRSQDIEAWVEATRELHRLRPYNQDFMRHLVEGNARLGRLSAAFEMMLKMQQQGLSVDWSKIDAVEPMRHHDLYEHLQGLMTEAGQPFGDVSVYSELGADYAMPEAVAIDDEGRMFVGTVRDGLILTTESGEQWHEFTSAAELEELQAVFDLAVDAERGHLWVATGTVSHFQGEPREDEVRSALLRLDLETGALQAEYPISSGSGRNLLGSLVLAGDGTVFGADAQAPVIYRLEPGAEALEPFFGHPNLTSLRGLALSDDDTLLYVADYELGIFIVDATGGQQAWQLSVPDTFNAGGIDGMFYWDDHLVVIQNAITPQRVVRLALGADGLGVTAVAPLAAAREEFDMPTFGAMDGRHLYFLGASHWHHVDAEGRAVDELEPVPVMKIDVDNASVQVVGKEVLEQLNRGRSGSGDQTPDEG